MTVKELINILATMPQEVLVVTEGYEDGYDTVKSVSVINVEENPQKEWYVGKYIARKICSKHLLFPFRTKKPWPFVMMWHCFKP